MIPVNAVIDEIKATLWEIDHNSQQQWKAELEKLVSAIGVIDEALIWCTELRSDSRVLLPYAWAQNHGCNRRNPEC